MLKNSAVKKCQPRKCFEHMFGRVENQAAIGPGIIFSKLKFKPIGMRHGLKQGRGK